MIAAVQRAGRTAARPLIVGIDGPSGAGNSKLAAAIARELSDRGGVIAGDDFYADIDWTVRANFTAVQAYARNYDWQRLRKQILVPARAGQRFLRYLRYDWDTERVGEWVELDTPAVLVIEGVYTLRPELRDLIDVGVYVDAARERRIARQRARHATYEPSIEARQNAMLELWDAAEVHYINTYDPGKAATWRVCEKQ